MRIPPQVGQKDFSNLDGLRGNRQAERDFSADLRDAIYQVSDMVKEADVASEKLIYGEITLHEAMIAAEKANLALQLTMSLRNKVMEAYQEIMRMQV